jgi:inosine-uridine nucleoside N-ribohydrolase
MKKVIFDTDGGGDDLWALLLLLDAHNCGEIELLGITTCYGNTSLNNASNNVLNFLYHCGNSNIPVFKGASKTLNGLRGLADDAFGSDGLSQGSLPKSNRDFSPYSAHNFLTDTLDTNDTISIIATGPATNIARVFKENPELDTSNVDLLWFGGAVFPTGGDNKLIPLGDKKFNQGNITHAMEFNAGNDVPASNIITNLKNANVTIMPMDPCQHMVFDTVVQNELTTMMQAIDRTDIAKNLIAFLQDVIALDKIKQKMDGTPIYDAQTVQYFLNPELFVKTTPLKSVRFEDKSNLVPAFLDASDFSPHLLKDHGLMSVETCQKGDKSNIHIVHGPFTFKKTPSAHAVERHSSLGQERAKDLVTRVTSTSRKIIFT